MDASTWVAKRPEPSALARLFDYKPFLIAVCLFPAVGLLMAFLTYPLGLGVYLDVAWVGYCALGFSP